LRKSRSGRDAGLDSNGQHRRNLSRRRFLVGTSALGISAALAPSPFVHLAKAQIAPQPPGKPDWDQLANHLVGSLLRKEDSAYPRIAAPYNLAYDTPERRPMGIAICATSGDVATAINWARDNRVPLVARTGGHSYAGYSMTSGLMIDVSAMRSSYWSPSKRILTVAGGARNQNLYDLLRAENRTVTHGRCPTVGAAGFLLGGGIGFDMRLHGVASDHLLASEIVTADGQVQNLSRDSNTDLFWACRGGGGGNFGINTAFTIETYPTHQVSVFQYDWEGDEKTIAEVAYLVMHVLTDAPDEFGTRFSIGAPNRLAGQTKLTINLVGQYRGTKSGVKRRLQDAIQALTPKEKLEKLDYWKGQDFLRESDGPFRFHERSAFLTKPLDKDAITKACAQLLQWQGNNDNRLNADIRFFQTGGVMNNIPSGDTAFVHRDSVWLMDIGLPWTATDPKALIDQNIAWQNSFYQAMRGYSNQQAYQNFVDPALEDYAKAYYGSNLRQLGRIKAKYDPDNLFKFPQSIPPIRS
jgi:hypothetical protein